MTASGPTPSLVGKVLDNRYEVLEQLGVGGVGVVYRARRLKLDRMVAVKVLHESLVKDSAFVRRFQQEAVAMSRLYHPHCVGVIDFGVFEGGPYLVLEYLPGENIAKLVGGGRFDAQRSAGIALQILETLHYFHERHVIHRDLKSENVMLVESGGARDFVKILDFGMAKILEGPGADSQLSKMGIIPGTPSAMAPEQLQQLPPDPRIDIYATGILLYEMIVGKRPFLGADMTEVLKMQLSADPAPPRQVAGAQALSEELEGVILKALQKDRFDRFGTAADMAEALRRTPEGRASAPPVGAGDATHPVAKRGRWRDRRTLVISGAAVALALLVAGVATAKLTGGRRAREAPAATPAPARAPPPDAAPAVKPPPAPVADPWRAHRDLAVTYAARAQLDDTLREVKAAVHDDAAAAGADAALAGAAVATLALPDPTEAAAVIVTGFPHNAQIVEALAQVTATGATVRQRHACLDALSELGQAQRADLVAMSLLDVEQATTCPAMREAFKALPPAAKEPRVKALVVKLRALGRKDPHVKCLGKALR